MSEDQTKIKMKVRRCPECGNSRIMRDHEYAEIVCMDCGFSDPEFPECFDFDHVSGKKKFILSEVARRGLSIAAIVKEISKCDIVCANCHRKRTAKRMLDKKKNKD